jgi:predicted dehydrogenase
MQKAASSPLAVPLDIAPEATRPLRVAIVGVGAMGRRHARVLAAREDRFRLVAVMDVDVAAAAEVAGEHGADVATREADAIARADAVVVANPIGAHAASVRAALVARRHVLVEKPIAATAHEAAELVAMADAHGARLFVGHSERFNPVVRALARLVEPASIAAIALRRVGVSRPRSGEEGALVNLGVHDFDLAAYLTRSPLSPTSGTGERGGAEERAQVHAVTASGAEVHVLVDQHPADPSRRRAIVLATRTHIWRGDLLAPSLVRVCRATGAKEAIPLDTEEPLVAQALAFAGAISARGGATSSEIATGLDGMRALQAAERARRTLRDPGSAAVPGENLAFLASF